MGFFPYPLSFDVGFGWMGTERTAWFFTGGSPAAALRTIFEVMMNR
jgi:hypothetical protein